MRSQLHRRARILAAMAAAPIVLVAGCSDDGSEDATSSTTSTSSTTTSVADGGEVITQPGPVPLSVGGRATLELEANPTTGYQWEPASEPDASVVRIVSDTYQAGGTAGEDGVVGAGGVQRIVIEGVAAGTTSLELRYVRPWESDEPPAETASYTITVG